MKIQEVINNIFRQNYKDQLVLGRSLFGLAIFVMGFDSVFNAESYASYAEYLPFGGFLAIVAGILFILTGFFILAGLHLRKATTVLIGLLSLFIILVYLPVGDIFSFIQSLALIGASLVIKTLTSDANESTEPA